MIGVVSKLNMRRRSQFVCSTALGAARYGASPVDRAKTLCFEDVQLIGAPYYVWIILVYDLRSREFAKSASQHLWSGWGVGLS